MEDFYRMEYFKYTKGEVEYLCKKDKKLASAIEEIGNIDRECIPDLYHALVHAMIGQQISTKAHATIWKRVLDTYGDFTVAQMYGVPVEQLQKIGITMKKAQYIKNLTETIYNHELDLTALPFMCDEEVSKTLVSIKGIGPWTAEMIMLHAMQRKDILSFLDLGIVRGMCMLYGHQSITKQQFQKYKKRYSPYGSLASLYLWAISAGAIPTLSMPKAKKENKNDKINCK